MKIIKSILLFSLAINFLLILISINLYFGANNFFKRPDLAQKMPDRISKSKIEFNKLVKKKFPIGLSEKELIRELNFQKFSPGWSYENRHRAIFETSNIACISLWEIIWEVDKQGRITEINGDYSVFCL
ncbi:MAG: hypothetical protein ACRC2R_27445 [Xenococcaceae cyanobacterium]